MRLEINKKEQLKELREYQNFMYHNGLQSYSNIDYLMNRYIQILGFNVEDIIVKVVTKKIGEITEFSRTFYSKSTFVYDITTVENTYIQVEFSFPIIEKGEECWEFVNFKGNSFFDTVTFSESVNVEEKVTFIENVILEICENRKSTRINKSSDNDLAERLNSFDFNLVETVKDSVLKKFNNLSEYYIISESDYICFSAEKSDAKLRVECQLPYSKDSVLSFDIKYTPYSDVDCYDITKSITAFVKPQKDAEKQSEAYADVLNNVFRHLVK